MRRRDAVPGGACGSAATTSPRWSTPWCWPTRARRCRCCCCSPSRSSSVGTVANSELVAEEIVRTLVGLDRAGRLGAGDDGAGGAGGLRGPPGHGARSRSSGTRTDRAGPTPQERRAGAAGARSDPGCRRSVFSRRFRVQPAFCSSARMRPSASSRFAVEVTRACAPGRAAPAGPSGRGRPPAAPRRPGTGRGPRRPGAGCGHRESPSGSVGPMCTSPSPLGLLRPSSSSSRPKAQVTGASPGRWKVIRTAYGSPTSYRSSTGIRKESSSETRKLIMTSA